MPPVQRLTRLLPLARRAAPERAARTAGSQGVCRPAGWGLTVRDLLLIKSNVYCYFLFSRLRTNLFTVLGSVSGESV